METRKSMINETMMCALAMIESCKTIKRLMSTVIVILIELEEMEENRIINEEMHEILQKVIHCNKRRQEEIIKGTDESLEIKTKLG